MLIVVVVLGILATIVVLGLQNVGGESAQAACKADGKITEDAVEYFKAKTGAYPAAVTDLVPNYMTSAPSTAHYTIALGQDLAPAASDPTVPATGPTGAPAAWPAGRVLVAPGRPPVDPVSYRRLDAAVNPPCDDPAIT